MRVGLLQIELDRAGRSRNLQRIIAAVQRAAQHRPAPDVLVLPAACDTGGAPARRSLSSGEVSGVAEALSWEARDWGIYIVCGLHAFGESGWRPCTVLFDADGDAGASTGDASGTDRDALPMGVAIWPCPQGSIVRGESVATMRLLEPKAIEGAFVAVPMPLNLAGRAMANERKAVESLVRGNADRGDAYWGLVGAAGVDSPCATCVLGPTGPALGEVKRGGNEAIIIVDVPIEPPPKATASGSMGRTDQAD